MIKDSESDKTVSESEPLRPGRDIHTGGPALWPGGLGPGAPGPGHRHAGGDRAVPVTAAGGARPSARVPGPGPVRARSVDSVSSRRPGGVKLRVLHLAQGVGQIIMIVSLCYHVT